MIKALSYSVTFPTGRTLEGKFDFSKGMTAITGSNESGKTMILEMVRFCMWGSKALRGTTDQYKTLKAELEFSVRGVSYKVTRGISKANLYRGNDVVATGTTAVNAKLIDIFGYDMKVFDVANNIGQGAVEALGNMSACERKAMVDQTIGLNVIDDLIDWLGDQTSAERKLYEMLSETLVVPVEPARPANYAPAADLRAAQAHLQGQVNELHAIRGWLSARSSLSKPDPVAETVPETAVMLRKHQADRTQILIQINSRKDQLARLRPTTHTEEDVARFEAEANKLAQWQMAQALIAKWPTPSFTSAELIELEQANEFDELRTQIAELEKDCASCPQCKASFPHDHTRVASLKKKLAKLPDFAPEPRLSPKQIAKHQSYLEAWAEQEPMLHEAKKAVKPEGQIKSPQEIVELKHHLRDNERFIQLSAEIGVLELKVGPDRAADLEARIRYDQAVEQYNFRMAEWEKYIAEKDLKETRLAELADCENDLGMVNSALGVSIAYEQAKTSYDKAKASYDATKLKADQAKVKADSYDKARKAMRALKVAIKNHLVPSLNRVSSHLISQMTAAQRNNIVVDENFDIEVDGQPLNTLSGSGKAVANLSIRIALGQVLTNKVFSVLMGDEIDASMDDDRAGYTAECLERLTDSIGQVVLVSHKNIDAEHLIQVK